MWRQWGAMSGVLAGHDHGHDEEHGHHDEHEEDHHGEEDHEGEYAHHDEHEEEHHGEHEEDYDDHENEAVERANFSDFGFYTSLLYGFNSRFEAGLRAEYAAGDAVAGLDDRFRLSPGLTYYINDARTLRFRVQYNYDHSNEFGTDHSVWGQVSFNWGGPEVR
jgi:hypothetical protein